MRSRSLIASRAALAPIALVAAACARLSPATAASLDAERQAGDIAAAVQRGERALVVAVPARDSAALMNLLAEDVVVVLPSGDTLRTAAAVAGRLRELLPADVTGLARARERGDACTAGKYEVGVLTAMRRPTAAAVTTPTTLPYAVEWRVDGTGTARIVRLSLAAGHARDREDGVRCAVRRSAVTQLGRRFAVALVASHDAGLQGAMDDGLATGGWQTDGTLPTWRYSGRPNITTRVWSPALSVRARWSSLSLEGVLPLMSTRVGSFAYNPELDSGITQTANSLEAFGVASWHHGIFRLGAGPTVMRTTWRTSNERMGRQPQSQWPGQYQFATSSDGRTSSIGATIVGGVTLPFGPRGFSEVILRYRAMQGADAGRTAFHPGTDTRMNGLVASVAVGRAF